MMRRMLHPAKSAMLRDLAEMLGYLPLANPRMSPPIIRGKLKLPPDAHFSWFRRDAAGEGLGTSREENQAFIAASRPPRSSELHVLRPAFVERRPRGKQALLRLPAFAIAVSTGSAHIVGRDHNRAQRQSLGDAGAGA